MGTVFYKRKGTVDMAKSVLKKKKTNRRLKKSVRRTLGALCMMTAIIVAAIPFPDAAAADEVGGEGIMTTASTEDIVLKYDESKIQDVEFTNDNDKVDVDYYNATTNGTAYTIANMDGDWQMDWQFRYYKGATDGYITKYNNQYQQPQVELNYRVFSDYLNITKADYDKYTQSTDKELAMNAIKVYAGDTPIPNLPAQTVKTLGYEYVLDADDAKAIKDETNHTVDLTKVDSYKFYTDYYGGENGEYEKYKNAYEDYMSDRVNNKKPEPLRKTYADVYPDREDQIQFFCDQVFGTDGQATGLELKFVDKRKYDENNEHAGWDKIYVPKLKTVPTEGSQVGGYYCDKFGFLANEFHTISGIAKNAFKGVTEVETLKMAEQISFIGNSAFEDSFVQAVILPMNSVIGNQAFKNCGKLVSVTIPEGVQEIGAEAFYGTSIREITIADSIKTIGDGAFANCGNLQTVTFVGSSATEKTIGDYCFHDCLALNNVDFGVSRIVSMGDLAFAVSKATTGNLTDFVFSDYVASASNMGNYLFGGRDDLQTVTMPTNLGSVDAEKIKGNTFYHCYNLSNVIFPDKCTGIGYEASLFGDVINNKFYVRGPKATPSGTTAEPRKSTWSATFNGGEPVPYVYNENGQDFYEISNGDYLEVIDQTGMLVSCTFADGVTPTLIGAVDESTGYPEIDSDSGAENVFKIPGNVGPTSVIGIKEGCFEGVSGIIDYIVALKIEDGSQITQIEDGVFSGAEKLKYVYIGDSVKSIGNDAFSNCGALKIAEIGSGVTSIGNSAFENCNNLVEIAFDNPVDGAASFPISNIGDKAFSTNGPKLTIYGKIDGAYGPFEWAMQPGNYMNQNNGLRVCYKSAKDDPQGMTVILDNSNNLPTLVDYPKYDDVKDLSGDTPEEAAKIDAALNVVVPSGVKSIDSYGYFNSDSKVMSTPVGTYKSNDTNIAAYFNNDIKNDNAGGLFSCKDNLYGTVLDNEYAADAPEKAEYEKDNIGNDRLESITLTSVEYLPDQCFDSCERLGVVNLGPAMTDVGVLPFSRCENITSVACGNDKYSCNNGILYENLDPKGNTKKIIECLAGRGKPGVLPEPVVSVSRDPDLAKVIEIADAAFSKCPYLQQADFLEMSGLEEIPDECFEESTKLTKVILPENVVEVGDEVFKDTGAYTEAWIYCGAASLGDNIMDGVDQGYIYTYPNTATYRQAKGEAEKNPKVTVIDIPEDGSCIVNFFVESKDENDKVTYINFYKLVADKTGKDYDKDLKVVVQVGDSVKKLAPSIEELEEYNLIPEGYEFTRWMGTGNIENITESCDFFAVFSPIGANPDDDGTGDDPNNGNNGNNGNTGNNGNNGNGGSGNGGSGDGGNSGSGGGSGSGDSSSPSKYTLTVVYGDGSGVYASGTKVIISAIEPPAGKEFYKWTTTNTGVTITSATSAATTVKTTNSDAVVTATYRDKSSVSSNAVNRKPIGSSGSTVQITKPGISNTDKAYASVSGSTDNFIIKITESTEAANAVATALSNKYYDMNPIKYFAMDISLYDKNGNKVTNTNGLSVNVTMPIPDALVQYGGNNKVGAVVNGNVLEDLNCKFTTVDGIPCVTFTATHFSPYTIYVDTSNLSVNTLDSTPKTGDGIHPKWFVSIALACISLILFMKRDKVVAPRKITV